MKKYIISFIILTLSSIQIFAVSGHTNWKDWSFDWRTTSDAAGLEIRQVYFKGKKVLLNFSVINCGNCKQTLDYINKEDYVLTDKIPMLYIDAEDDYDQLMQYKNNIDIPYPVIASAEDIARDYKVNSYPRFFLVNEEGIIEKIQRGYSEEFLDEFRQ